MACQGRYGSRNDEFLVPHAFNATIYYVSRKQAGADGWRVHTLLAVLGGAA
jgi:hypothetical protein